jgi:protein translocase SecG subunit
MELQNTLQFADIILAIAVIALVLLQRSGADVGGALGSGDGSSSITYERRGAEKTMFRLTIIVSVAFICLNLFILVKQVGV